MVSSGQVATAPKSVVEEVREPPAQEDQVVSSGQVAIHRSPWWRKSGSPRTEDQVVSSGQVAIHRSRWWRKSGSPPAPSGSRQDGFWAGQASVAEVGVSPTERQVSDACQDGCQDGLRPERSPAVGPLSVAVRLGPRQSCQAEGQVSGVPQACGGCGQVRGVPRAHCRCGSSHGKGGVGDW